MTEENSLNIIKSLELAFIQIKNDWKVMEERLTNRLMEVIQETNALKQQIKATPNRLGGFTVAELAKLKALGYRPQDLLSTGVLKADGAQEKQEK